MSAILGKVISTFELNWDITGIDKLGLFFLEAEKKEGCFTFSH